MRKNLLIIGTILLVGGAVSLGMSTIRVADMVARSINDDDLSAYLDVGEHELYAENFLPESHPVRIRIRDPYGNLIYEGPYLSKTDFTVVTTGIHRVDVTNVDENNGVLEVNKIVYPYQNLSPLSIVLIAVGICLTVASIIKPYQVYT